MPFGRSITYSRSSAVKAIRRPSGDGAMSRIWCTANSGESVMGYLKASFGPSGSAVRTRKGTAIGALPLTGTRQIFPPYVATSSFESGVNDIPGYASRLPIASWSSRCTG